MKMSISEGFRSALLHYTARQSADFFFSTLMRFCSNWSLFSLFWYLEAQFLAGLSLNTLVSISNYFLWNECETGIHVLYIYNLKAKTSFISVDFKEKKKYKHVLRIHSINIYLAETTPNSLLGLELRTQP